MDADGGDPPAAILRRWINFGKHFIYLIFLKRKWAHLGHFLRDQDRSEYHLQRREWRFLGDHLKEIKRRGRLTLAEQVPPRDRARVAAEPEPAPEPARAVRAGKGAGKGKRGRQAREEHRRAQPWLVEERVFPAWLAHERANQNEPIPGLPPAAQINVNVNIVNNAAGANGGDGREGAAAAAPAGEAARTGGARNAGRR